ncbi:hypothetical protein RhiirA4_396541, partial [Rhizophagus irregularis]
MDGKLLIELLEGLTGPQNNDGQLQNALLERCIKASGSELKEFLDELSQLLCESPNIYLPVLQLFISHLRDESSRIIRRRNLQNTVLLDFFSMLITIVIMNNLHHSDILGFREILRECIELLWKCLDDKPSSSVSNKNNNQIKMTTKRLFSAILNAKGVLEVLLSESSGRYCLKRILFEFNMINEIEQNDLLNAVDMAASLLKKCSNHMNVPSKLSDGFSIYKACASLLESLKNHQNTKNFERNSLPPNLLEMVELNYEKIGNRKRSVSNSDELKFLAKDEKYIILLGMETPRKLSDLPKFSRDLEKRKINSFKDWIGFWPCEYCHKLALINFSPEKYSHLMEEEKTADVESEFKQNFRLPFEFDDSDKLGPWDILLSEDTVKDMQRLESPLVTKAVMKVLGRISSGEWDKHKLQNKKSPHDIPVYEVELSDNKGLKIIWQIDYGFSIRSYSLTQLVKIWSITKDQNQIDKILVNLKSVHKVYAPENNYRYEIQKPCNGIILPKNFDDNEGTRSTNDGMSGTEMDNENLLEVHKMLVTNKFIPLSQNLFKSLILGGSGFTFNVSKIEYEIINNPTSAIIIGRSDIAQCIARGSSFRFQNLSTLIYKWELDRTKNNHNQNDTVVPKQFELNINYRSHNGILRLASSVIDLIHHFFPDSIDHLSRERSEVGGPRPIVFKGFQAETFLFDVFSVDERMPNCSEFGAEQVIIVRNEEAKKSVGNVGIVMTVFEAKGMEFNDVLLYNFFTHSPARQKWRLILSALDNHSKGIQTFSHEKHYILSSELKHLYVAVTRARQHLWIFDEDSELSEPIRIFWGKDGWDKSGLIKVIQSLEELNTLPTLTKKSSSHDWNRKGKLFFERRQYELAKLCFSKSENEMGFKLANAYNLQKIARSSLASNSYEANVKSNFISAAKAFETCSRPVQAASCYKDIGMNREAGDVYERWDMFEDAAYCYLEAKAFDKAGKCFEKAEKYTDAVVAYKDGSLYKEVVNLMQRHRERIDEKIFRRITRFVNIYYRRENNKVMSKEALSILSTHEEQIELLRDHAPEELLKVCEERGEFQDAAKELHLRGKFKEAADMFIRSNDEKDIIEALQCLLDLCKVNILNIITDTMNQSILEELKSLCLKANEIVTVKLSKSSKRSDKLKILIGELQLYSAYLSDDLDRVRKCIQFFKENEKVDTEFHGINMWLKIVPQSYYESEYWHERLQYLIRLWGLSIPYICAVTRPYNVRNISEIYNDFENIFLVCNDKNRLNKRKILTEHPFRQCKSEMGDAIENIDNWHVYEIDDIHQTILKIFAPYIFELTLDVNQKGREIPEISSHICHKFTSCQKSNCLYYHVEPTPSVLHQRATLARLQYTVIRQTDILYHRRLIKDEQSIEVRPMQRWWSENLIKVHFRYQSPQTSCPEVTYMMIDSLSYQVCNVLNYDFARRIWLKELSKDPRDFAVMLKCMFVFQQLRNEWGIEEFSWEMSKKISLSHPDNLPIGFSYFYGYYQAIPVGKRLSLFFGSLYSNYIINAITQLRQFIQYAIDNAELVNLNNTDAFGDLVSLMEFKISLIFAIGPGYCDFCLPRSYLVNYFDVFTAEPLVLQTKDRYRRSNYCSEIRYSTEQIQKLLELLIREDERYYLTIILRLIRLLVLIGRNESSSSFKVISLFKSLIKNDLVHSGKVKKYLEESNIVRLVNILKDDLKETGCDLLVIVHYQWGGISRFQELEKSGVVMLKYNSVESFHSSLWKILSSVVTEKTSSANKLLSQRADVSVQNTDFIVGKEEDDNENDDSEDDEDDEQRFTISREGSEVATKIQVWFRQIQEDPRTLEAVKRIQYWFRMTNELRQTPNQLVRDKILDKIYNDTRNFCWNKSYWEDAINHQGTEIVRTYNMLLKGSTVDVVVELTKLQDKMNKIKNQLQKTISDRSIDDVKLESCLNLEDDLKHIHSEN